MFLYAFSPSLNYPYSFFEVSSFRVSALLTIYLFPVPCQSHLSLTFLQQWTVPQQRQQSRRLMPAAFPVTMTSVFCPILTSLLSPGHFDFFPYCHQVVLIYLHLHLPSNVHFWWYMTAYYKQLQCSTPHFFSVFLFQCSQRFPWLFPANDFTFRAMLHLLTSNCRSVFTHWYGYIIYIYNFKKCFM